MDAAAPLLIMIAGPYGTDMQTDREKTDNLRKLNEIALIVLKKGHIPVVGINNSLPLAGIAGPGSLELIALPISLALAGRCDACLRTGGPSATADAEVEEFLFAGKPVYYDLEELPETGV